MQTSFEIRIREALPQDAGAIAKLLYDSFAEFEGLYTREGFAATSPTSDQILKRMQEGPVWIAFGDSIALSTCAGWPFCQP
jgi:hypothetical protein